MDSQDMTINQGAHTEPQRVVEFEWHRPRREDIRLPKVDTEPVRRAVEEIALTGIGLAIVTGRAVNRTIQAARRAGSEEARHPGPFTRGLLELLGHKESESSTKGGDERSIPVLPIANYTSLDSEQVIARLAQMNRTQLETLRNYELGHDRRTSILKAIDGLMETAQ
jgi:hypothetical protein